MEVPIALTIESYGAGAGSESNVKRRHASGTGRGKHCWTVAVVVSTTRLIRSSPLPNLGGGGPKKYPLLRPPTLVPKTLDLAPVHSLKHYNERF